MKRTIKIFLSCLCLLLCLAGCSDTDATVTSIDPTTPDLAIQRLISQNALYIDALTNSGDISTDIREETVEDGQSPYAVVLTCSDSRVTPEHIFMEGIGQLFTIRNAGNIVDEVTLGSVEYGAEHLGAQVIVVLGHTNCGAVDATISGGGHGNIAYITDTIAQAIGDEIDPTAAEIINVENSIAAIMESPVVAELVEEGAIKVVGAIYDTCTGEVVFMENMEA